MNTNTSPAPSQNSFDIDIEIDAEEDPELFAFIHSMPEEERPAALIALIEKALEYKRTLTEDDRHP